MQTEGRCIHLVPSYQEHQCVWQPIAVFHKIKAQLSNKVQLVKALYEEIKMYLWSRTTGISGFTIFTVISIPPWGAVSSWTTQVTPFALANMGSYD